MIRSRFAPSSLALAGAVALALLAGCASDKVGPEVSRSSGKSTVAKSKPTFGETYIVNKGDTLYSIAFRNNLDYHDLADWNGIGRDYAIRVGQVLRLTAPGSSVATTPPAASSSSSGSKPAAPARKPVTEPSLPSGFIGVGSWEWPTRGKVARGFDDGGSKGVDIAGDVGQVVVASRGGRVVYSGAALKGYGELIIIKHDDQYLSAYGYNRRRLVAEGEDVGPGQPIAELGIGPEQKPLLHFEIRDRGRPIDPRSFLPSR